MNPTILPTVRGESAAGGARGDTSPRPPRASRPPTGRRLRVVHCLDSLAIGGTELNAVRTLELLDRAQYELALVTMATDGPLWSRVERTGVPIHSFSIPNFYGPRTMRQAARVIDWLRRFRPDVVHCHDLYSNIFMAGCARAAGVPFVLASRRWLHSFIRPVYRRANQFTYRHVAHAVLANSEELARLVVVEGTPRWRVHTIPNFVEADAFVPIADDQRLAELDALGVPRDALVVGAVTRLRPEKDIPTLLSAVAKAADHVAGLHLVLVGDGECEADLRRLVVDLGLTGRAHFAGFRPNRPNPHSLFDVSVLSSLHEGFPNTIIEAMAVGRPVLATGVGGVPDVVTHGATGILVPPADPDGMAEALIKLAHDPGLRRRLGDAALRHVAEHFHADGVLERLGALYASHATTTRTHNR